MASALNKMASGDVVCAGCLNTINCHQHLKCSICMEFFDLMCANVSECRFVNTMTSTHKATWKCQACKCKEPKGDNSNTPIRQTASLQVIQNVPRESLDNVTIRRRAPESSKDQSFMQSCPEDAIYVDHIKEIIREELERNLREYVEGVISKRVSEHISSIMVTISRLRERLSALEHRVVVLESSALSQSHITESPLTSIIDQEVTMSRPQDSAPKNNSDAYVGKDLMAPLILERKAVANRPLSKVETVPLVSQQKTSLPHRPSVVFKTLTEHQGEWVEVTKHRRRSAPQNLLKGRAAPGKTGLEASERIRSYHLFFVKMGTTVEQVSGHIKSIINSDCCRVEALKARGPYASFKLSLPSRLSDRLLAADQWPEDVCIKPWRKIFRPREKPEAN
ncbi:unnamed protein product [Diatraea saccharalis]|uniref:Uncharacterized protein n=1 Tax=Diatraea saccharalis TaxID=40085 RepID=A0A9N9R770_9NEOP|nr:unnamed protein product [Diatraea saccharalis]